MAVSVDLQDVVKHLVDGTFHQTICRICLLPFGEVSESILTKICTVDQEFSVADILDTVCQIKCSQIDNFNICQECFKLAFDAYKFFVLAKRSDEILNYYVEELESNVYSIETMFEHHDSLCITLPEYVPYDKCIDFNVERFLKNRTSVDEQLQKNSRVEILQERSSLKFLSKQEMKSKPPPKLNKCEDEEVIIVIDEDGKTRYYKIKEGSKIHCKEPPSSKKAWPKGKHRKKRDKMVSVQCSQCPVKYSFLAKLKMHMKVEHNIDLYVCKICKATFEDEEEFKFHQTTHSDVHICNFCSATFKRRDAIIAHLQMHEDSYHSNTETNICELCGVILPNEEQLQDHYEKKHIKKFTCFYCGKMYKGELSFESHIKKHEMHLKSVDNNEERKSDETLDEISKEEKNKKRSVCTDCGRNFVDDRSLLWHSMLHMNQRPYVCDVCGRGFVSVNRRNQHLLCAHSRPTRRCPLCPALFHLRSMVNTHIKKVHLKAHKRRNRTSKHQNVSWKTEPVPIQELSVAIQNDILELQSKSQQDEESDYSPLPLSAKYDIDDLYYLSPRKMSEE